MTLFSMKCCACDGNSVTAGSRGHGVETGAAERMASRDTTYGQPRSPQGPMCGDGLDTVVRARRFESTGAPEQRRKYRLIRAYQTDDHHDTRVSAHGQVPDGTGLPQAHGGRRHGSRLQVGRTARRRTRAGG